MTDVARRRRRPARRAGGARRRSSPSLTDDAVAPAHAERGLDGRRPDRSPHLLRRRRRDRRHRPGGVPRLGRRTCSPPPMAATTRSPSDRGTCRRRELLAAWRANRRAPRRGGRHAHRRPAHRLVRPVDGGQVVPHRPPHGVLGPRPGHRRHGRRGATRHRPAAPHRAARLHHPRLELRQPRHGGAGRRRARRAHRPVGRRVASRARGRRRRGRRARPSTSASSSPSVATSTTPPSTVSGAVARDWMERAQAFAGPPTDGRRRRGLPDGASSRPSSQRRRAHRHPRRRGQPQRARRRAGRAS